MRPYFSTDEGMKLESNHTQTSRKSPNIWKFSTLPKILQFKKEVEY